MNVLEDTPAIELERIHVSWGEFAAVRDVSFTVPAGQFVAIVGPSGCGKTSLLNITAGLLTPTSGTIRCNGSQVKSINRSAAYLFQQDALLPWKTVLDNVMLGPVLRGTSANDARKLALDWIERVGMRGFHDRYPAHLSGGQRKRVAIAQALVIRLPILLMDEPFSALDVQTRALVEDELLALWKDIGATVLFVTHDLEEAIALADRVLILSAGPSTHLKGDYPVDLPRPRNVSEIRFLPEFMALHQRIWTDLKEEVSAAYARNRAAV